MDWDVAVLVITLLSTVAAFVWRRTRLQLFYWAWLALIWIETQTRKHRDRRKGPRSI